MQKDSSHTDFSTKKANKSSVMSWENEGGRLYTSSSSHKEKSLPENWEHLLSGKKLWGQQTEKSLKYFNIAQDLFDEHFIMALIIIKKSMVQANYKFSLIDKKSCYAIVKACDYFLLNIHKNQFPVKIWQTGSGTQINMNVNEVLATTASIISQSLGNDFTFHPNDHINMSQSSNDVIPSAINLCTSAFIAKKLIPTLEQFETQLHIKEKAFKDILTVGRTHMMDALPITLGQQFGAFRSQISHSRERIKDTLKRLTQIPLGGTAVGTGVNCPAEVSEYATQLIGEEYEMKFSKMDNLFYGVSTSDDIVELSGQLKALAAALLKLTTDITILSSGPDSGINELRLPQNEAGSSIMPGKANPTQCEALAMICCQVIGNDTAITLGGMQGKLQLNTFRPLIIKNIFHSLNLLNDGMKSFSQYCLLGIEANREVIDQNVQKTKMIVTLISPLIGYDKAAKLVEHARKEKLTIREAVINTGIMFAEEFDTLMESKSLTQAPKLNASKMQ